MYLPLAKTLGSYLMKYMEKGTVSGKKKSGNKISYLVGYTC